MHPAGFPNGYAVEMAGASGWKRLMDKGDRLAVGVEALIVVDESKDEVELSTNGWRPCDIRIAAEAKLGKINFPKSLVVKSNFMQSVLFH